MSFQKAADKHILVIWCFLGKKTGLWMMGPHGELVLIWLSGGAAGHPSHFVHPLSEHHLSVHPEQWLASV